MTDEELINQLRQEGYDHFGTTYSIEAADRIEQLIEGSKGLAVAFATVSVKREMTEAKLAKAIGVLKEYAPEIIDGTVYHGLDDAGRLAQATLAELEK